MSTRRISEATDPCPIDRMIRSSPSQLKRARNRRGSTIKFRCDYSSTPLKVLQARGWTRNQDTRDNTWDIWWCDTSELKLALDGPTRLEAHQRVSHFRNHCELTRKNYLYRNLRRYRRLLLKAGKVREAELCDAMPMSFELPSEYRMLVEEHRRCHGLTWIVKPAAGSQGRGIFLFQRLKDLADWRGKECASQPENSELEPVPPVPPAIYVVQKYIDNPYLLEGRKFDLRIYVLVTSFQPLKVWLAREGFARLSGEQFSLERIDERRVHLTNMAIQLKCRASAAGEAPLGRKVPLSCLRRHLTERHGDTTVERLLRRVAENGNLSLHSLKQYYPNAKSLAFDAKNGRTYILPVTEDEILLGPKVNEYSLYMDDVSPTRLQSTDEARNDDSEPVLLFLNDNDLQNVIQNLDGTYELTNESENSGIDSNDKNAQGSSKKSTPTKDSTADPTKYPYEAVSDSSSDTSEDGYQPATPPDPEYEEQLQSLRVGWLHKEPSGASPARMSGQPGGERQLKLDEKKSYTASYIRQMAIKAFEMTEGEYALVQLSLADGHAFDNFSAIGVRNSRKRIPVDDIWTYCRHNDMELAELELCLLTTDYTAGPENEVRVLYHYCTMPNYPGKKFYTECNRLQLHKYVLETHEGTLPRLDEFEPLEYGYNLSRIEKAGKVYLQMSYEGEPMYNRRYRKRVKRKYYYPSAKETPGSHRIVHDLDELSGISCGDVGLGIVTSCNDHCRPIYTWFKDGRMFKCAEELYWLNNVCDGRPHVWQCRIRCPFMDKDLVSVVIETVHEFDH